MRRVRDQSDRRAGTLAPEGRGLEAEPRAPGLAPEAAVARSPRIAHGMFFAARPRPPARLRDRAARSARDAAPRCPSRAPEMPASSTACETSPRSPRFRSRRGNPRPVAAGSDPARADSGAARLPRASRGTAARSARTRWSSPISAAGTSSCVEPIEPTCLGKSRERPREQRQAGAARDHPRPRRRSDGARARASDGGPVARRRRHRPSQGVEDRGSDHEHGEALDRVIARCRPTPRGRDSPRRRPRAAR